MLYLTCTTITSVDLTLYGVSRAKHWVSVDCGTIFNVLVVRIILDPNYNLTEVEVFYTPKYSFIILNESIIELFYDSFMIRESQI